MNREERVTTASLLRDENISVLDIAKRMSLSRSYVYELLTDPEGVNKDRRRESYRGRCERCGKPTDGSGGNARHSKHCYKCDHIVKHENRRWTKDAIILAIRRWADEHAGIPPIVTDWKFNRPAWAPSQRQVQREWVTWNKAIEAAGFQPTALRRQHSQSEKDTVLELYRSNKSAVQIESITGVNRTTVSLWVKQAGIARTLSEAGKLHQLAKRSNA